MGLYRSMAGTARVRVTGADPAGLLEALRRADIPLDSVAPEGEIALSFTIARRDIPRVRRLCEKRGDSLALLKKMGLYWPWRGLLRRPVLVIGLGLLLLGLLWLPSRVFFVRVEGNSAVSARRILEAAEASGIHFAASRREVRSERVKNALLEAMPELQWAGVNTSGCVAVISVREKPAAEAREEAGGVSGIVACCDAVVRSATATRGSLLCRAGQAVRRGQTLISGYTDCGLTIQAAHAQGEVYGWTRHALSVISPTEYWKRGQIRQKSTAYSLILGKNRINLWKGSGISGSTCDRIYEEYTITLPGGFLLPVTLVKETMTAYETEAAEAAPGEAMADYAEAYLLSQLIAGQVDSREERLSRENGVWRLQVDFHCTEMIGRRKTEEIGDIHG